MNITPYANVVLHGGPPSLDPQERVRHTDNPTEKIKLLLGNRYEHFEPTSEIDSSFGHELVVYVWKECTYVAE